MLTGYTINSHYVQAVRPTILADWLLAWRHLPLPQLQAKALQMESGAVTATQCYRTGNTPAHPTTSRPQDPNRIKCPKCNWWHRKDEPCRTQPHGGANHSGQPNLRVQEANVGEREDTREAAIADHVEEMASASTGAQSEEEGHF